MYAPCKRKTSGCRFITSAQRRRIDAKKISDAQFADDIALVTNTVEEAEEQMREMESISMSVGLTMNERKTKYTVENIKEPEGIVSVDWMVAVGIPIVSQKALATNIASLWYCFSECATMTLVYRAHLLKGIVTRALLFERSAAKSAHGTQKAPSRRDLYLSQGRFCVYSMRKERWPPLS